MSIEYNLSEEEAKQLERALLDSNLVPPLSTLNALFSNLLKTDDIELFPNNVELSSKLNRLLFPTEIYVSYNDSNDLKDLDSFQSYIIQLSRNNFKLIKKIILIKTVEQTGTYQDFLDQNINIEDLENSLIHLSYIHSRLQNKYKVVYGLPSFSNYVWLKLDCPLNVVYRFGNKSIRKTINHLFYIDSCEKIYSPVIQKRKLTTDVFFNFKSNDKLYENRNDNSVIVPIISDKPPYNFNFHLYGGYNVIPFELIDDNFSLKDLFKRFPRMFTIDLITIVKEFLTYYAGKLPPKILRKLNLYFTKYRALSLEDSNPYKRDKVNYYSVSFENFI